MAVELHFGSKGIGLCLVKKGTFVDLHELHCTPLFFIGGLSADYHAGHTTVSSLHVK